MREHMKSHRRRAREDDREATRQSEGPAPADRAVAVPVPLAPAPERDVARADREPEGGTSERQADAADGADATHRDRDHTSTRADARRAAPPRTKVQLPTAHATQQLAPQAGHAALGTAESAPMLRMGDSIPNTLQLENINVPSDVIVGLLQSLAIQSGGGFGRNADFGGSGRAAPLIESAIQNKLTPRSVSGEFIETNGANCKWNWRVTFRTLAPVPMPGSGTGTVQNTTGGTGTVSNQTTTSTTDSAKITGSGTGTSGTSAGSGGGASSSSGGTVGAELGTSTTRTDQNSTTIANQNGTTVSTTNNMMRYMACVVVDAQVSGELDTSGTDYINPLKWGMYLGEAIDSMERASAELIVGTVEYYRSEGIAPSAPPAPAMRKSWVEHELGLSDPSEGNARKAASAAAVNPATLSRSGAQPVPTSVTAEAGQRQGTDLGDVHLIRGGPADTYCDAMSAAAFTTPNPTGGSDIFVHSNVDVASARGQHTLQHELAHAAQLQKGEAASLTGLGGDATRRQQLEKNADAHADEALATAAARPERKWTGQ
jgi:hypothetical protein